MDVAGVRYVGCLLIERLREKGEDTPIPRNDEQAS